MDNASDPEERIQNGSLFVRDNVASKRIQNPVGFASANNEGARMGSAPYILFLNDDCILQPDAIEKMLETMQDAEVGVVGARLTLPVTSSSPNRPAGKIQHVGLALSIRSDVIHPFVGWPAREMASDNLAGALAAYNDAAKQLPGNPEVKYWAAVTLITAGKEKEALAYFKEVFAKDSNWVEVTRRLPASGLLPDDPALMEKIVSVAPKSRR